MSTAFFYTSIVQDFQDSPDDEEDTRSSLEYLNDLEEEYKTKSLLAKSKRFFKKGNQSVSAPSSFSSKNKGLIAESYDWDQEEVSSDDEETKVKALMALTDEERIYVAKESNETHSMIYVILTDSPTLASEDMIHSKEVDIVRMGLRRSSSLVKT
ncbi:hypothetical protein Tco_1090346 [Tanacetum coccineum]|uniref:Uncharacterized protein n=1 Tax=Tanacetum coccineum TaxID=301880 RepID=A0ABQ5I436_9ASTR